MKITLLSSIWFVVISLVSAGSNEKSKEWLEENAKKDDVIVLPSGLQYKVLRNGKGKDHPDIDTPCDCLYEGKLIDGLIFDGSRGEPTTFAPNQVIKGWTEAMQLMVEGDKWELYVPSELGYGDDGSPPKIKGGDALIFEMEIVKIKFDCDPLSFKGCSKVEKAFAAKAKRDYGLDPDFIEEGISELEGIRRKLAEKKNWKKSSREMLERKLKILRKLLEKAVMEDEL